jgi:hypothetical protein
VRTLTDKNKGKKRGNRSENRKGNVKKALGSRRGREERGWREGNMRKEWKMMIK